MRSRLYWLIAFRIEFLALSVAQFNAKHSVRQQKVMKAAFCVFVSAEEKNFWRTSFWVLSVLTLVRSPSRVWTKRTASNRETAIIKVHVDKNRKQSIRLRVSERAKKKYETAEKHFESRISFFRNVRCSEHKPRQRRRKLFKRDRARGKTEVQWHQITNQLRMARRPTTIFTITTITTAVEAARQARRSHRKNKSKQRNQRPGTRIAAA